MIKIDPKFLQPNEENVLKDLQSKIDKETLFEKKAKKVQALWNSKGGTNGKAAFQIVKNELTSMCVYVTVCNYCEQSEANDIEHIYPKSYFPGKTFEWENYILACKQCNSALKIDKFYVIDAADNAVLLNRGSEPSSQYGAFINPRNENPNDFLYLNLKSYKFETFPDLLKKDQLKAEKTLEILELNQRDLLIQARKSAAIHYYDRLTYLNDIMDASDKQALKDILNPYDDKFDFTKSLAELKNEIKGSIKKYIQTYQHPSVWYSIKLIESKVDEKWMKVFKKNPEALNW